MLKHKYLLDAGVSEKDIPWNWCPEDDRQPFWEKQREEYGFDEEVQTAYDLIAKIMHLLWW